MLHRPSPPCRACAHVLTHRARAHLRHACLRPCRAVPPGGGGSPYAQGRLPTPGDGQESRGPAAPYGSGEVRGLAAPYGSGEVRGLAAPFQPGAQAFHPTTGGSDSDANGNGGNGNGNVRLTQDTGRGADFGSGAVTRGMSAIAIEPGSVDMHDSRGHQQPLPFKQQRSNAVSIDDGPGDQRPAGHGRVPFGADSALTQDVQFQVQMRSLMQALQDGDDDKGDYSSLLELDDATLEDVLLMLLDSGDKGGDGAAEQAGDTTPPCKYFIMGKCYRADCWYSHDLKKVPCKHFAAGWCSVGAGCPFGHDDRMLVRTAVGALRAGIVLGPGGGELDAGAGAGAAKPSVPDMNAFPTLGTSNSPPTAGGDHGSTPPPGMGMGGLGDSAWGARAVGVPDLASKLKLNELQEQFPAVWNEDVSAHFYRAQGMMSDAIAALKQAYPGAWVPPRPKQEDPATVAAPALSKLRKSGKHVDWVETGANLGSKYQELRESAIDQAVMRNRYFQEATAAFMRGDKRAAKELSRQGRTCNQRMDQQHREAAAILFDSRNASGSDENVIDLHGKQRACTPHPSPPHPLSSSFFLLSGWWCGGRPCTRHHGNLAY